MRYISTFCIILFLVGCKTSHVNSISKEIKDEKFYSALVQAINIAEKKKINSINIFPIFTANNLYIYILEGANECSRGNYFTSSIKINQKDYYIDFDNNKFLNQHVDTSNLKFTPLIDEMLTTGCEKNGYVFRYMKKKDGKYQLKKKVRIFDIKPDFISKEDRYLFRIKVIIPEPEPFIHPSDVK